MELQLPKIHDNQKGDFAMPEMLIHPRYKIGDKVRLVGGVQLVGTVTEATGSYRPDGHALYRVRVPMEEEPLWLLVREDEIEKA